MTPEARFDPEFSTHSKGRYWSGRTTALLLALLAVIGLTLAVKANEPRRQAGRRPPVVRLSPPRWLPRDILLYPQLAPAPEAREPFVVVAQADIDRRMVVPAPRGIDEQMVVHPRSDNQPANTLIVPRPAPQLIPVPHGVPQTNRQTPIIKPANPR
jgi:hypothetical protein